MNRRNYLLREGKHLEEAMAMERIEVLSRAYREIGDILDANQTPEVCEFERVELAYSFLGDGFIAAARAEARFLLRNSTEMETE